MPDSGWIVRVEVDVSFDSASVNLADADATASLI